MNTCNCGCEQPIVWKEDHRYRPPRFIVGHNVRTAAFAAVRELRTLQPSGEVPSGFCECGCGGRTQTAKRSNAGRGHYNGHPIRFIRGHQQTGRLANRANAWKGGRAKNGYGYWMLRMPGHHLADKRGYVLEHRLVWEQANGRRLRPNEDIHHIDGDKTNNAPENLMALSPKEHGAIHAKSPLTQARKAATMAKRR